MSKTALSLNIAIFIAIAAATYSMTVYFNQQTPNVNVGPVFPIEEASNTSKGSLPDFTFTSNGKNYAINDFKDKIIIINFWASWCPPCIKEMPNLIRAAAEHPDRIALIALSSDIDEKSMNDFLEKYKFDTHPENIYFAWDENQTITNSKFQTFKLPETILVDHNLQMKSKLIGADWAYEDLLQKLEEFIGY